MNCENNEIVEKKEKRGRKKKYKEVEPKIKKKRGRKASSQFYSSVIRKKLPNLLDENVKENDNVEEEKNIIIHLDINEQENQQPSWSEYNTDYNPDQLFISQKNNEVKHEEQDKNIIQILKSLDEKNWPEKTNVKCWWCCHNFDSIPLGIPMKIYNELFYLKGCFCSFNCILSYIKDYPHIYKYDYIFPNIKSLRAKLTKHKLNDVLNPAPPREALEMFGGELTIEKFRSISESHVFKRINYPMKIITDQLEKMELIKPVINKVSQVIIDNELINQAQIRISKNKEMKTTTNTLDKFLLNF